VAAVSASPEIGTPTGESSRRERRKLEMRNRILEAAFELFGTKGVEATKVTEICDRADVAHKTFFNHFPTKQHVLREIALGGLGRLLEDIEDARKQPGSSRARIRHFFTRLADNAEEAGPMHRELLTAIIQTVAGETTARAEQAQALHDAFGAIVSDGRAAGDLCEQHDSETLTAMLMGGFYVLMFNWANLDGYPLRDRALATARFLEDAMTTPRQDTHQ
jgi:AcrR family transcriptional regulator